MDLIKQAENLAPLLRKTAREVVLQISAETGARAVT
jgi:hypothetical protein